MRNKHRFTKVIIRVVLAFIMTIPFAANATKGNHSVYSENASLRDTTELMRQYDAAIKRKEDQKRLETEARERLKKMAAEQKEIERRNREAARQRQREEVEQMRNENQQRKREQDSLKHLHKKLADSRKAKDHFNDSIEHAITDSLKQELADERLRRKIATLRFDENSYYLRYFLRDSLRLQARLNNMSMSTYRKWVKYFHSRTQDAELRGILDSLVTVPHNVKYISKPDTLKRRTLQRLANRSNERHNENRKKAIDSYVKLKHEVDSMLRLSFHYDSIDMSLNPKYRGKNRFSLLRTRNKQREKRLWHQIDIKRRQDDLSSVNVKSMLHEDSLYNIWRDSLKAHNIWQRFALHTNTVGWVLGVPNIGIEFDLSSDPSSQYSVLVRGYYKPNLNNIFGNNERFAFNIRSGSLEVRKYWRTGGMQTTMDYDVDDLDWAAVDDYGTYLPRNRRFIPEKYAGADTLCAKDSAFAKRWAKISRKYDNTPDYYAKVPVQHLYEDTAAIRKAKEAHHDTTAVKKPATVVSPIAKVVKDTIDIIPTASWFKRLYQPFRYKYLTGRYYRHPRTNRAYYLGAIIGIEQYHWQIMNHGRQGKAAYVGLTFGMMKNLTRFRNGSSLDLDLGIAIAAEKTTYAKLGYNNEYSCYTVLEDFSKHARVITPYPVIKDLHVSLVYSFRGIQKKAHNLFLAKKYYNKMETIRSHNARKRDRIVPDKHQLNNTVKMLDYEFQHKRRVESDEYANKKRERKEHRLDSLRHEHAIADSIKTAEREARIAEKHKTQDKVSTPTENVVSAEAKKPIIKEDEDDDEDE